MGPDPTQAYFLPAVNKGQPAFDPGTFWPDPKRFFLTWGERNWKIWLGETFRTQAKTKDGWGAEMGPDPTGPKLTFDLH